MKDLYDFPRNVVTSRLSRTEPKRSQDGCSFFSCIRGLHFIVLYWKADLFNIYVHVHTERQIYFRNISFYVLSTLFSYHLQYE